MNLPQRKANRLNGYNYSQNEVYFITICSKDKKNLFGSCGGAHCAPANIINLSEFGGIADNAINNIPNIYKNFELINYVVMPNHIHLLLMIKPNNGSTLCSPTISMVIKQFKGYVTKLVGFPLWQRSFHDHIIRNEKDYLKIWEYIENNPIKWKEDCYFSE